MRRSGAALRPRRGPSVAPAAPGDPRAPCSADRFRRGPLKTEIELDAGVDDMHDPRALSIVQEPKDQLFTFQELARLDEALTMSSRETGLRFTLYIGDLGKPTRVRAEELHGRSGGNPAESVLIALSPGH